MRKHRSSLVTANVVMNVLFVLWLAILVDSHCAGGALDCFCIVTALVCKAASIVAGICWQYTRVPQEVAQ